MRKKKQKKLRSCRRRYLTIEKDTNEKVNGKVDD